MTFPVGPVPLGDSLAVDCERELACLLTDNAAGDGGGDVCALSEWCSLGSDGSMLPDSETGLDSR